MDLFVDLGSLGSLGSGAMTPLSGSTGKISTGNHGIFPCMACMGVSMGVRFFFVPPIH